MASEKLSILVISYNRATDLLELLQSIARQEDRIAIGEVLILNNASTDSYANVESFIAQETRLSIRYEVSFENLGVSRGRNRLMKEARFPWLLVLDDDILLEDPLAISKMASVFEDPFIQNNRVGIITFRVLYAQNRLPQISAFPHKHYEEKKDLPQFLTYYFTGCCHLMRKELLEKTGYYPSDFFYGMEEYDLSYRCIAAGYNLAYDQRATVLHKESPEGRQPTATKLASQWINKSKVAWRYLPTRYFLSTAIAWSIEFCRKAGFKPGIWLKSWGRILAIPFQLKRQRLSKSRYQYLKSVNARLSY